MSQNGVQDAILTFENVSRMFGAVRAVDNVSFELKRGEMDLPPRRPL